MKPVRHAVLGLSAVVALVRPVAADGTYSLDMSGAMRAHVTGRATGEQASIFSDAGPSFHIVLHLPKGTAPGDNSGEEFLVFAARSRPAPGRYETVDPGDEHADQIGTFLSGHDETPWETAGGHLDLVVGNAGKSSSSGTFNVKFVKLDGMRRPEGATDTLFVSGRFEIP